MAGFAELCIADINYEVCLWLDGRDLAGMMSTCRRIHELGGSEAFWADMMRRKYGASVNSGNRRYYTKLYGMSRIEVIRFAMERGIEGMVARQWSGELSGADIKCLIEEAISRNLGRLVLWILNRYDMPDTCVQLRLRRPPRGIDNSETLLSLLAERVIGLDWHLYSAVASFEGDQLRRILDKYPVPHECVSSAFVGVAIGDRIDNFVLLLSRFNMDDETARLVLEIATVQGSLCVLQHILSLRAFDTSVLYAAIRGVAICEVESNANGLNANNHGKAIRAILQMRRFNDDQLVQVVSLIADRGKAALLDEAFGTLAAGFVSALRDRAMRTGESPVLIYLVERGYIEALRGWTMLRHAILCRNIDMLEFMHTHGSFSQQDYYDALTNIGDAIDDVEINILVTLVDRYIDVRFDDDKLVKTMAKAYRLTLVDILIAGGATLDEHHNDFLLWACANGFLDLVTRFVADYPDCEYSDAIAVALNAGHRAIADLIGTTSPS